MSSMDQPLQSANSVLNQIKELWMQNGEHLSKREMKKMHPDIVRSALYYYPSWEHAVSKAIEPE